jgi:hypothetical protein
VTPILFVVLPLVVLLCLLIGRINKGEHYAPQAYYRRKRGGAPVAYGFDSLGPRPRKRPPGGESSEGPGLQEPSERS